MTYTLLVGDKLRCANGDVYTITGNTGDGMFRLFNGREYFWQTYNLLAHQLKEKTLTRLLGEQL